MKKINLIAAFLLATCTIMYAQDGTAYVSPRYDYGRFIFVNEEGHYMLAAVIINEIHLLEFDDGLNLLSDFLLTDDFVIGLSTSNSPLFVRVLEYENKYYLLRTADAEWGNPDHYGAFDIRVDAFNHNFDPLWGKNYGGSDYEYAIDFVANEQGELIVLGRTKSCDHDVSNCFGNVDHWVFKIDTTGQLVWEQSLGDIYENSGYRLVKRGASYFIVGSTDFGSTYNGNGRDAILIEIDEDGNVIREIRHGGTSRDEFQDVAIAPDGGYYILGSSYSSGELPLSNYGKQDIWLLKYGPDDNLIWSRNYGGSNHEWPTAINLESDGAVAVLGISYSSDFDLAGIPHLSCSKDIWVFKTDEQGNFTEQYRYGGNRLDKPAYWLELPSGTLPGDPASSSYIITGETSSDDCTFAGASSSGGKAFMLICDPATAPLTSSREPAPAAWSVFPNPVDKTLHLSLAAPPARNLTARLFNLIGQIVAETQLPAGSREAEFNLSSLERGVYFLHIDSQAVKVVKE
ncbi:MAG: T9SS type A sorting domain-containing protein [Phaeodactylibacter sp.]|nr:T9SS type A sorting domain-containing protein [Phaeodactylibacter sp.]